MRSIDLVLGDVETAPEADGPDAGAWSWRSDAPLPAGAYTAEIACDEALPFLHLTMEVEGPMAPAPVALMFTPGRRGRLVARVWIGEPITAARIRVGSWSDTPPARIRLKRANQVGRAGGRLLKLVLARARNPATLLRAMRTATRLVRVSGLRGLFAALREGSAARSLDYPGWIRMFDTLGEGDLAAMRRLAEGFGSRPVISVIMPVYNTPLGLLRAAIDSVTAQTYPYWELCIADDASTDPAVRDVLAEAAAADARIRVVYREQNGHISEASNSALALARGDWVALLDHDDVLRPHALFCVADAINRWPDARLIYSDEDKLDESGNPVDPYFKPDWNPDLFLSHNLITHLGVYAADLVREVGGFRRGYEGAQDYDLALRCVARVRPGQIRHIPHVLYHWRIMAGSTALSSTEKPYAMIAGERALNEHLAATAPGAKATLESFGYRVHYPLPDPRPLVSIIIPTRDGLRLVETCVDSIRRLTTYQPYEILLVDNGSTDPAALAGFARLEAEGAIRVLRDDRPFNYSQLNNSAARQARGEVLALLNNDIEVIEGGWLSEMVSHALRPGIGAVGAKLLYPNRTIQHAGVILGLGGVAGHAHQDFDASTAGYVGRAALISNFSAVTGACLVVSRETYLAAGGLNEVELKVAYNDIDFCLRLGERGLRTVYTPYAVLLHHESATRGHEVTAEKMARFAAERAYMARRWGDALAWDPAYNPNLTVDRADFGFAFPPRARWPWRPEARS